MCSGNIVRFTNIHDIYSSRFIKHAYLAIAENAMVKLGSTNTEAMKYVSMYNAAHGRYEMP